MAKISLVHFRRDDSGQSGLARACGAAQNRCAVSANFPDDLNSSGTSAAGASKTVVTQFNAHWMLYGWLAWFAGMMVVLARAAAVNFIGASFSQSAQRLQSADWIQLLKTACDTLRLRRSVTLLQSANDVMPMTWGWWHPVVLLPAEASAWPEERRRIVLLHELAHIKRGDFLTQSVVQMVCALYWFNPLVWVAARQMCVEREGACDDLVLSGGCKASDYAGHLVEIAASFRRVPQMAAIAMARSSQLEGRVAAIVDVSRNRRLRSVAALAVLSVIAGVAVCLGGGAINSSLGTADADALRQQQIERLKAFSVQKRKAVGVARGGDGRDDFTGVSTFLRRGQERRLPDRDEHV